MGATGLALYGRKLWETMSSHWPTADKQPGATPAAIEYASRWRDMPKVVFSSTISTVDWNTRLVTGDAVTEITRLKAEDGGPMDIGGATLAAAAMRAGLIDEYVLATAPVLVGGGTPFFTALDNWVNLSLVETRTFPDGGARPGTRPGAEYPTSDRRGLGPPKDLVALCSEAIVTSLPDPVLHRRRSVRIGIPNGRPDRWLLALPAGEVRLSRRPVVECLVGAEGVVGVAELVDLDGEGVAVADDRAVEVLVLQGAEEPFDHAVGLRAPHPGADVPAAAGRRR